MNLNLIASFFFLNFVGGVVIEVMLSICDLGHVFICLDELMRKGGEIGGSYFFGVIYLLRRRIEGSLVCCRARPCNYWIEELGVFFFISPLDAYVYGRTFSVVKLKLQEMQTLMVEL